MVGLEFGTVQSEAQIEFRWPEIEQLSQIQPTLAAGIERRNAIALGRPVKFNRYAIGQQFGEVMAWSVGYCHLSHFEPELRVQRSNNGIDSSYRMYKLRFIHGETTWVVARNEQWKFSVPLGFGLGVSRIDDNPITHSMAPLSQKSFVTVWDAGLRVTWYFRDWIGLTTGMAVRLVPGKEVFSLYTGPNYHLGLAFFPLLLYEKVTGMKPISIDPRS